MRERLPIEERFVWWLWQTRRFDRVKTQAAGWDVVFTGWFSTSAGPDFRDAMVANRMGHLQKGAVEVHVDAKSWADHGHHLDPAYDAVILHVVLNPPGEFKTVNSRNDDVPTLALLPLLTADDADLKVAYRSWKPELVACPLHSDSSLRLHEAIRSNGEARFQAKAKRMVAEVEALGEDEALYRNLAEALGYSANREPFRKIAEALPFALLSSLTLFQIEHVLLAAAGLITEGTLLSVFIEGPAIRPEELVTFRVRPGNAPSTRLRGLARLIHLHRQGLGDSIRDSPIQDLWKLFVVEADTVLIGRGRADDIVINVALPYLVAYEGVEPIQALERLPAPSDNRWVKSLKNRLEASGAKIKPYRALQQQGLLELALRFCRYDHCEACPLHAQADSGEPAA